MQPTQSKSKLFWLTCGVLAGIGISSMWPHEPAQAAATDRSAKFAIATCEVTVSPLGNVEGVFILDFLTGQLRGGVVNNKSGKFNIAYARNIAADFNVDPNATPTYAIISGRASLPSSRQYSPATGVIYIAELTSGKVVCYSFPYENINGNAGPFALVPVDGFQFRDALPPN